MGGRAVQHNGSTAGGHRVHPRADCGRWRLRPSPRGPRGATSRHFSEVKRRRAGPTSAWVRSPDRSPARGLTITWRGDNQTTTHFVLRTRRWTPKARRPGLSLVDTRRCEGRNMLLVGLCCRRANV